MGHMKCLRCICGIRTDESIWCARFKGLVTQEIEAGCQDFVDRSCFGEFEDQGGDL
jgi:hypothetical protein